MAIVAALSKRRASTLAIAIEMMVIRVDGFAAGRSFLLKRKLVRS